MSHTASYSRPESTPRYYGKYRGLVIDNIDPEQIGRMLVQVPDVLGEIPSSWAMPCVPAAGIQSGCFIVPPIGSQVWVEFEQGNPDYPDLDRRLLGTGGGCANLRHRATAHSAGTEHRAADARART